MNRDQKAVVVDEIAEQFKSADAVFAVDYRGISVAQAADLRERLREVDSRLRVVKNSLSERAADQAGMELIKPMLTGPTALTFVSGDAAAAAKALNDAARALQLLEFKGGVLGGSLLSGDDVRSIARLPSRDVMIAQLVATIAAPLSGLARTLNALVGGLAIQLQAIADQGLVSGEPPAPAEAAPAAPEEAPAAAAEEAPAAAEAAPAAAEAAPAAAEDAPAAAEAPAEPEAAAEPEVPAEPEAAAEPEVPAEPEPGAAAPEPEAAAPAEPDAAAEPTAEPDTEATSEPETSAASDAAESD
jgi:large subunit ribosomal protein L10